MEREERHRRRAEHLQDLERVVQVLAYRGVSRAESAHAHVLCEAGPGTQARGELEGGVGALAVEPECASVGSDQLALGLLVELKLRHVAAALRGPVVQRLGKGLDRDAPRLVLV